MRHFFLPACLCLMALPGTTGNATLPRLDRVAAAPAMDGQSTEPARDGGISTRDKSESTDISIDSDTGFDAAAVLDGEKFQRGPPRLPPQPHPVVARSREEICDTLTKAAHTNGVPVAFFIHLLFQESRFQPGVVSSAGAEGIAQFMPETSARVGLDNPFDPAEAIPAAARLLRELVQQFGNFGLAAAAYNAGPRRIQDWLEKKSKLPEETQGYVKTITGRAPEMWIVATNGSPAVKLPRHAPCQEAAGLLAWDGPEHIPMPPAKATHGALDKSAHAAPDKTAHAAPDKDAHKGAMVADRAHGKKSKDHTQVVQATNDKAQTEKSSNDKTQSEKAPNEKAVHAKAAADKPAHANSGKKDSKTVTAQLAAARHKRGHKSEKVAQN